MMYFSLFYYYSASSEREKTLQTKLKEIEEQLPKPEVLKRKSKPSMKLLEATEVTDEPAAKKKVSVRRVHTQTYILIYIYIPVLCIYICMCNPPPQHFEIIPSYRRWLLKREFFVSFLRHTQQTNKTI